MNLAEQHLADRLAARVAADNLRQLPQVQDGIDFFSNDYLGLAARGVLNHAMTAHGPAGTGATGSRLLSGNSAMAVALEERIAAHHHAEAALLFNSGYDANLGLLTTVADRHTTILYDELCHASIIDGVRLSLCGRKYSFAHNDVDALEALLRRQYAGPVIVVTESVFSMDGDCAPLAAMADVCAQYGAQLVVDEAHATGVFGMRGEGLVHALGLCDKVFARVHTYGKAMGCHGAAVTGSHLLRQALVNFARSFIYTTALPPHSLACIDAAYDHIAAAHFTNDPLHQLVRYFRSRIGGQDGWGASSSPIQVYKVGDTARCKQVAASIRQAGMQVSAIVHPTVPRGGERLRICLHSFNTGEEVDRLLNAIHDTE